MLFVVFCNYSDLVLVVVLELLELLVEVCHQSLSEVGAKSEVFLDALDKESRPLVINFRPDFFGVFGDNKQLVHRRLDIHSVNIYEVRVV